MKGFFLTRCVSLGLSMFALAVSLPLAAETVTVAAAANLASLERPLQAAFAARNPGISLQWTFAATGTLVTQLTQGAPYQVFLSADRGFAQKVVDLGVSNGPVVTYAVGRLIFLATKPLPGVVRGLSLLTNPEVRQIAVANPETAPYGKAALEALTNAAVYQAVKSKLVMAQSIAQTVQFTVTATGYGLVNQSALFAKDLAALNQPGKFWFEVDPALYTPLEQGYVVVKAAEKLPAVLRFCEFLASDEARVVFEAFGYTVPD